MPAQPFCCVCGRSVGLRPVTAREREDSPFPLTVSFHHVPSRSLAGPHSSGVRLCGSGTTGCHGLAEDKRIEFKHAGGVWYFRVTDERTARRVSCGSHRVREGVWYRCHTASVGLSSG